MIYAEQLPADKVQILVEKLLPLVENMETDTQPEAGVSPEGFLRHVFASREFMGFVKLMADLPGAYEDNIRDIITKVIPEAVIEVVAMK